jgi:hypothetical protein
MAHPIYSFIDKKSNDRFFIIWDTIYELPFTVPMNILTFLQYWGIDNKDKVSALYSIYPRLIQTGTSLNDYSFEQMPDYLQQQAFDYVELGIDPPNKEERTIITQLEELFTLNQSFVEFYSTYLQMIELINRYPKRPLNYYLSWNRTGRYFFNNDSKLVERISELALKFGIPKKDLESTNNSLRNNLFRDYKEAMVELFYCLGEDNLISLDAIPHIIRSNANFNKLFADFGMESYLPETRIQYDVRDVSSHGLIELNDVRYLRQFVNVFTFEDVVPELMGLRLRDMTQDELRNILSEKCWIYVNNLLNVKDKNGNLHIPMKYTSHFLLDGFKRFYVLAPYDRQCYHVFDKRGRLIDDRGYYDFNFIQDNVCYFQNADNLSWVRWQYNDATQKVIIQHVEVIDAYSEEVWSRLESEYQNNLLQVQGDLFEEKFSLLELVFEKTNKTYSLYLLSKLNKSSAEDIKSELILHLKHLLYDGDDLQYSFMTAFQLFKSLVSKHLINQFEMLRLNIYNLSLDSLSVRTEFIANYLDENFTDPKFHEITMDRSLNSFHSLQIIEDRGSIQTKFMSHFIASNFPEEFRLDCEAFTFENPLSPETDCVEYGNRFITHLKAKGYEEVKVFTQHLNVEYLVELLGCDLNEEGRFNPPSKPEIDLLDELPF